MKKILILLFTLISLVVSAQIFDPVDWSFTQENISESEIELKFKATIEDGWHLYSQHISDDGPVPTEFSFITTEELSSIFEDESFCNSCE